MLLESGEWELEPGFAAPWPLWLGKARGLLGGSVLQKSEGLLQ